MIYEFVCLFFSGDSDNTVSLKTLFLKVDGFTIQVVSLIDKTTHADLKSKLNIRTFSYFDTPMKAIFKFKLFEQVKHGVKSSPANLKKNFRWKT